MPRRLVAATIASLMLAGGLLPAAAPPPHPVLARGLALMRDGDFEGAVLELDAAVRKLEADPAATRHRAWAYVYLGVAYLELEQEAVARGKFREALARDPALQLLPAEFSAQSIRVFEGVRAEAAAVAQLPAPAGSRPRPGASAAPSPEKKGSKRPLVAVLLGGAAAAGVAVALGGGGGGDAATTTTAPIGGGTTTVPGPSPSPSDPPSTTTPGAPTTTTPGPTTTTTTPGPAPTTTQPPATTLPPATTQPPATTLPPSCTYDISGQVDVVLTGCVGCTCSVSATPATCAWNAQTSNPGMISITQGAGTGNGNVRFNVGASLSPRTGRITLAQGGGTCTVSQGTLFGPTEAAGWSALLALAGGAGQITVNSSRVTYQAPGIVQLVDPAGPARVEALVVTAAGRPGTWRFQLPAGATPGSVHVVAGDVVAITADTVTFRLAGRPGERLVFTFAMISWRPGAMTGDR